MAEQKFESYTPTPNEQNPIFGNDNSMEAQTFTTHAKYSLTKVRLKLQRIGAPTGVTVEIRNTTPDGAPGATVLGSSSIDPYSVSTETRGGFDYYEVDFPFSPAVPLENGTKYAIVLRGTGLSDGVTPVGFRWAVLFTGGYGYGDAYHSYDGGASWTKDTWDFWFETYGTPPPPTLAETMSSLVGTIMSVMMLMIIITMFTGLIKKFKAPM
jgi:hypothetical protein